MASTKNKTPEESEFAAKKAKLEKASKLLAEKELDLEELKISIVR